MQALNATFLEVTVYLCPNQNKNVFVVPKVWLSFQFNHDDSSIDGDH